MTDERGWLRELVKERAMKDEFMARHPESPFVAERIPFHPLKYFPPNRRFRVAARLERREVPEESYLRTNRDGQSVMRHIGDLLFRVGSRDCRLRVYHAGEGVGTSVFVPFRDASSGKETYGPGRYLTLELNESDEYELDFNRSFNPYCAYTDAYECGFPPSENDLPVAIRAGEKVWAADRNPRTPNALLLDRVRARVPAKSRPPSSPSPTRGSRVRARVPKRLTRTRSRRPRSR
ncbi:MAG: DUF1684 domain-containing protein [Candidatus Thermoplasmatota archaeon]|jgi:uncharacterized protein (DUF1684 family)|nr:DUF1684 domain-containing protein [Candidatus Thermoplasmatota archaeon]MCL5983521.1 DUF1684 domain-containing protein [Candidatus Thermoplasmatota archaeon]